jgi:vacuolar protein sorting-associated protein VTA1
LYSAARTGIALKPPTPNLLSELLSVLETLKEEIGPNDAIDMEAASIAYVENFGLKVFNAADEEDRGGIATRWVYRSTPSPQSFSSFIPHDRSTAKKFLAAANFLEVLHIFPPSEVSESASRHSCPLYNSSDMSHQNEEKIRYAKWKAADIAKAFREGRTPMPGPPRPVQLPTPLPSDRTPASSYMTESHPSPPHTPPAPPPPPAQHHRRRSSKSSPPRTPPREHQHLTAAPPAALHDRLVSPGSWSTHATPGTPAPRAGSRRASVETPTKPAANGKRKGVHFAPSPPPSPSRQARDVPLPDSRSGSEDGSPGHRHRDVHPSWGGLGAGAPPPPPPPLHMTTVQPWAAPNVDPFVHPAPSQSRIQHPQIYRPPSPPSYRPAPPPLPPPLPPQQQQLSVVRQTEVELTPMLISKTQKHCRFAISALDYEDAETARRELRAALALLDG